MKSRFLFPHWARIAGYLCFLAYIPVALLEKFLKAANEYPTASFFTDHLFKMVILMLIVIGLLLVAFSKEKIEDERIAQLRLDSLQWSIYLNYAILINSVYSFYKRLGFVYRSSSPLYVYAVGVFYYSFQVGSLSVESRTQNGELRI